mmetsp:Transcript_1602/g.3066  ORF Transcript_1602/g.3066 Transcript_1602/m.3066 type:complete len:327 (+) Transcript_1602:91-1071(+)
MTWVMQLRRAGYLFSQLGGVFLVHYPHLNSQARMEWDRKPRAMDKYGSSASELLKKNKDIDWGSFKRARVDALFLDFKEWLDGTVEDESRVPMCEDALNDDVRLWVHTDKQEADDDEEKDTDDGAYFEEYNDYQNSRESYEDCQNDHWRHLGNPAECFKAASAFIESSILWSLVGAQSGYVGPQSQMEYLVNAEKCATRFLAFQQDDESDEKGGGNDKNGDYSFRNLVADLYTNMGVFEKNRDATAQATAFIMKALELNPKYEAAQKILSQLAENEVEERTTDEQEQQSPGYTESTGEEMDHGESSGEDTNVGGNTHGENIQESNE